MAKSYKKRTSSIVKIAKKELPVIDNGLKNAGYVAKDVAKETIPIVEKGVSAIYGTMNTGFNLGVKGAKNIGKGIKNISTRKGKSGGSRRRRNRNTRSRRR